MHDYMSCIVCLAANLPRKTICSPPISSILSTPALGSSRKGKGMSYKYSHSNIPKYTHTKGSNISNLIAYSQIFKLI